MDMFRSYTTKATRLIELVLLAGFFVAANADEPTITAIDLVPRQTQDGGNLYGYILSSGKYYPLRCPDTATITFSGVYAGCKPTSSSAFPMITGCRSSSIMVDATSSYTCASTKSVCGFDKLYRSLDDKSPYRFYGCGFNSDNLEIFMQTTGSTSATSTNPASAPASATITTETSKSTETIVPPKPSEPQNLAWIAGPVIGGVAGIAIVGLIIWIIKLKRRKNRNASTTILPVGSLPPGVAPSAADRTSYFTQTGGKLPADSSYPYNSQMSPVSPMSSTTPGYHGQSPFHTPDTQAPPQYQSPQRAELPAGH